MKSIGSFVGDVLLAYSICFVIVLLITKFLNLIGA